MRLTEHVMGVHIYKYDVNKANIWFENYYMPICKIYLILVVIRTKIYSEEDTKENDIFSLLRSCKGNQINQSEYVGILTYSKERRSNENLIMNE